MVYFVFCVALSLPVTKPYIPQIKTSLAIAPMNEYNIVMLQSSIRITYLDSWLQLAIKQKTQAKILSLFIY